MGMDPTAAQPQAALLRLNLLPKDRTNSTKLQLLLWLLPSFALVGVGLEPGKGLELHSPSSGEIQHPPPCT